MVELLIQPGTGVQPLLDGIEKARKSIHIVIFRFDRGEIEAALKRAVRRGVFVHALVAYTTTGQGGEKMLRALEMRLLADGVSVARTATDLARYHDKMMVVDSKTLYLLGFNYTYIDIERSRSFGVVTQKQDWVKEAEKLFHADTTRQSYQPECPTFLVSPGNSRQQLIRFVQEAKKQLLIYDGKLTDLDMIRLLLQKAAEGVEVRVIGAIGKRASGIQVAACPLRLHAQTIVRDQESLFLGSQSLRTLELDARREVGLIIEDADVTRRVFETFEADWAKARPVIGPSPNLTVVQPLPILETTPEPVSKTPEAVVKETVKEAIMDALLETLHDLSEVKGLKLAVKEGVKEALGEVVQHVA